MPIEKFTKLNSTCIPVATDNVDTDQIIPARFLKRTSRKGFGNYLFYDQRFNSKGEENKNNVFNNKSYNGKIIVAGKNFGCGSSREHAPWAIMDYGIKVVIATSFADIFRQNSLKNGLLVITLNENFINNIFDQILKDPLTKVQIDLAEQSVFLPVSGETEIFEIDNYRKECLLMGYDDIDYILNKKDLIEQYEDIAK